MSAHSVGSSRFLNVERYDPTAPKGMQIPLRALSLVMRPPAMLDLAEWAEENMVLSGEASAQRGKFVAWPFQIEPLRVMSPRHPCEKVVMLTSSQTMKTSNMLVMLAYVIAVDPGPVLFVEPRQSDAEALSKDRITPMIRDTPALHGKVADAKSRDAGNTIDHKRFIGGHLSLATATSPSSLAMRPIRYLFLDEISRDQYRNSTEGDPVKLAEKRTENFPNRKIIYASSPSEEGNCRISDVFRFSDQRQWNVPCPYCGHFQVLEFVGLVWSHKPNELVEYVDSTGKQCRRHIPIESAEYRCAQCDNLIPEKLKPGMNDKGKYIPTNPNGKYPGFRVNRLVSPITRWGSIAQEWEEAHDRPPLLKVFVNTVLAETYKIGGDAPPWEVVASRREPYQLGTVPNGVRFLTAGIDVQKNWIDLSVWGWGRNRECWLVDKAQFQGRTSDPGVWQELTAWVNRSWQHPHGAQLHLARYSIDTGHETNMVYSWVRKQGQVAIAVKGYDNLTGVIVGHPSGVDIHATGKRVKRGILVWPVDVSKLKSDLYGRLSMERPPDGANFPSGWIHLPQVEDEFCKQLTAESLVEKKDRRGYMKREWVKNRERNEALDEWNYARAAAHILGVDRFTEEDWHQIEDMLGTPNVATVEAIAPLPVSQPAQTVSPEAVELDEIDPTLPPPQVDRESWAGSTHPITLPKTPTLPNPPNLGNNQLKPNSNTPRREPLKRPGGWLGRSGGGWTRR